MSAQLIRVDYKDARYILAAGIEILFVGFRRDFDPSIYDVPVQWWEDADLRGSSGEMTWDSTSYIAYNESGNKYAVQRGLFRSQLVQFANIAASESILHAERIGTVNTTDRRLNGAKGLDIAQSSMSAGIPDWQFPSLVPNVDTHSIHSLDPSISVCIAGIGRELAREAARKDGSGYLDNVLVAHWSSAASFLVENLVFCTVDMGHDDVVELVSTAIMDFAVFAPLEILAVYEGRGKRDIDVEALLRRAVLTEGYSIQTVTEMVRQGLSADAVLSSLRAGVDVDLAAAIAW